VELRLDPYESCFVVFGESTAEPTVTRTELPGPLAISRRDGSSELSAGVARNGEHVIELGSGAARKVVVDDLPEALVVEGPWALRLGPGSTLDLPRLVPWNEIAEGRSFSGWARYATSFVLPALGQDVEWRIDLGEVHETAEVALNGEALGAAWKAPRTLTCGTALRPGRNALVVEVANLWIHHVVSKPPPPEWKAVAETFGIRWGRYGEVKPEKLPPAGLLGPVRFVPLKRVRVRL
jgi:hypothetical protein